MKIKNQVIILVQASSLCLLIHTVALSQDISKASIILDADTGNEADDYYALTRALVEDSWDVICLNATQWQASQWAIDETMENSHRLNQVLLGELGSSVLTRRGGVDRMFDWGDMAQHSAAAYEIIKQVELLPEGEKLNIIALGALTNIGSAAFIQPSIASRIRLYWLGTSYDFEENILKRQDFNCMMDQQALEIVLMSEIEMHVMPVNVAQNMVFDIEETQRDLPVENSLSDLLLDRWREHLDGGRTERVIWDLALIQAILVPDLAKSSTITTSRDHGSRTIHYYSEIDASGMKQEFFQAVRGYNEKSK